MRKLILWRLLLSLGLLWTFSCCHDEDPVKASSQEEVPEESPVGESPAEPNETILLGEVYQTHYGTQVDIVSDTFSLTIRIPGSVTLNVDSIRLTQISWGQIITGFFNNGRYYLGHSGFLKIDSIDQEKIIGKVSVKGWNNEDQKEGDEFLHWDSVQISFLAIRNNNISGSQCLVEEVDFGNKIELRGYDRKGNLTSLFDGTRKQLFFWHNHQLVKGFHYFGPGAQDGVVNYQYSDGYIVLDNGPTSDFEPQLHINQENRLISISTYGADSHKTTDFTYDSLGNLVSVENTWTDRYYMTFSHEYRFSLYSHSATDNSGSLLPEELFFHGYDEVRKGTLFVKKSNPLLMEAFHAGFVETYDSVRFVYEYNASGYPITRRETKWINGQGPMDSEITLNYINCD